MRHKASQLAMNIVKDAIKNQETINNDDKMRQHKNGW